MHTKSNGATEEVMIVKKMADAEGGGYTVFVSSVGERMDGWLYFYVSRRTQ